MKKHTSVLLFLSLGLFTMLSVNSCKTTDGAEDLPVYPAYADDNGNLINDYTEKATHEPGTGHSYGDADGDGICDFAQDGSNHWHGPGFTDANSNGVCDYWDENHPMHSRHEGMRYHDANGNGINDYMEPGTHQGRHDFTDSDGDGICDYAQDGSPSWHGPGFVDQNNDGICDYWEEGGRGRGGMGGMNGGGMHR